MGKYIIKGVFALCLLFSACTQVDVCYDASHPHNIVVDVNYSWSNVTEPSDSMVIIACRPISAWACGYICSPKTANGKYIFNRPEWLADDSNDFSVRCGELMFATFNSNVENLVYLNVNNASAAAMGNVLVENRTCTLEKLPAEYAAYAEGWNELNSYAPYIIPCKGNLVYQKTDIMGVSKAPLTLDFEPKSAMKNVTVAVNVVTGGVQVDKVIGELSGVSYRLNMLKGNCVDGKTAKMLFEMKKSEADTYKADLSLFGVVANENAASYEGDGILQLAIHSTMPNGENKVFTARINLANTLFNIKEQLNCIGGELSIEPAASLVLNENGLSSVGNAGPFDDKWLY